MPQIEENVKYTLEETVSIRALVQAAMDLNGDSYQIHYCAISHSYSNYEDLEILDIEVYPMSGNDDMPSFYIWSNKFVYFPCQNDLGVKWVSSVPCIPNYDISPKVIRV